MSSEQQAALHYLIPDSDGFWQWDYSDDAICWRSGKLIAFRQEVVPVLRQLAPHGLPPFDSIVLFLAACRQANAMTADDLKQRRVLSEPDENDVVALGIYHRLLAVLDAIGALPMALRDTVERKAILAGQILEARTQEISSVDPSEVVRILEARLLDPMTEAWGEVEWNNTNRDGAARLASLAAGAAGWITADRVELRRRTGLDQLPHPLTDEAQPAESLRSLISRLADDEELGGMARLARNLAAVLTLPRAVSEPQDLPIGGVSDISNRGSFDRLLVSELANDDLTFTVRVANSEALYLRREAPPYLPPRQRLILIDNGLRMWGLPRVYATAAGLALALSGERRFDVSLYRPREAELDPIAPGTREGLIEHLAALECDRHPGAALPTLFQLAREHAEGGEVVLITCEETLADPEFRAALDEQGLPELYVITASRHGTLRLSRRSFQGSKLLKEVICSLDDVFDRIESPTVLIDPAIDPGLPAILRLTEFPLRLPHPVNPKTIWDDGAGGVFAKTSDGRLMHWDLPGAGARQRGDTLPPGRVLWHSQQAGESGTFRAVIGKLSQTGMCLVQVDLRGGYRQIPLTLAGEHPRAIAYHGGAILVIFSDHVEAYSENTGNFIVWVPIPAFHRWHSGRFFWFSDRFAALAFDGTALTFVPGDPTGGHALNLLTVFDVSGMDGPACVMHNGEVNSTAFTTIGSEATRPASRNSGLLVAAPRDGGGYSVRGVSADGERVVLAPQAGGPDEDPRSVPWFVLNLKSGTCETTQSRDTASILNRHLLQRMTLVNLRKRFDFIHLESSMLTLSSRNQQSACRFVLGHDRTQVRLFQSRIPVDCPGVPFLPMESPPGAGYRLKRATWQDGSRAYLDSRGMLHLVSSDPTIPELTLVLSTDGPLAGWCSEGGAWGPSYYSPHRGSISAEKVYHEVLCQFMRRLR